jgi:type I restriction enzyme R subunit
VRETPPPYGENPPGGYRKRKPEDYDRALCLLPRDAVDFVLATQPKAWKKLEQHHGAAVREQFLKRLASEIERRGALDVLRNGIKDSGCKFRLAYFRPASGLNDETRRLHAANLFAAVRQLRYSAKNEKSLDLVLFLNGIPTFTAELKNPLSGQDVEDAIRQYKADRDPREPLLAYRRCLAHFAVDPDLVYVTTRLSGARTRFLPFNQGKFGGAGNPPVPPTRQGYAIAYLWEETWARDSVLDLVRQFVHEVEEEDDKGRKTGKRFLIYPRYQQLDCVRRLVADARARRRAAVSHPAFGRERQELHHRLARPPAFDVARCRRPSRFRLDRGRHRPPRARPPASDDDAPVRADARRGREHRHHLAPAQGGARVGQDDHRHHAPEVPGHR